MCLISKHSLENREIRDVKIINKKKNIERVLFKSDTPFQIILRPYGRVFLSGARHSSCFCANGASARPKISPDNVFCKPNLC